MLLPLVATAQFRFGYISYDAVCRQMSQYSQAQKKLEDLKAKYEQESVRNEEEFQRKFNGFLQGQKDFPSNILQKRQAELQDVMEKSIAFRQEAVELLNKAEKEFMQDVYNKLNAAIKAVALEYGYAFVLNIDDNAAPYINPEIGDNVTDLVRAELGMVTLEEVLLPKQNIEVIPIQDEDVITLPEDEIQQEGN